MREFQTETGVIAYEVLNEASTTVPTITLLHNFMSTGRAAWASIAPTLAERFRVLLPDLPGHGRSQGYPAGFHYGEMGKQIAELMQAEGATDGHLAGCSAGGMIAQLLVQQKLVQPRTVTLISTTYSTNPATTGNTNALIPENFKASPRWMETTATLHDPYHYAGYYQEVLLTGFRNMQPATGIDLPLSALRTWPMPVCLIQGELDEFFPPFIVEGMAQALPNAELHLIPEQTHALIFRQPWKVRELMIEFLARHDDQAQPLVQLTTQTSS
jgi:pimeloyl-ACP methyl ester carboxylesterase